MSTPQNCDCCDCLLLQFSLATILSVFAEKNLSTGDNNLRRASVCCSGWRRRCGRPRPLLPSWPASRKRPGPGPPPPRTSSTGRWAAGTLRRTPGVRASPCCTWAWWWPDVVWCWTTRCGRSSPTRTASSATRARVNCVTFLLWVSHKFHKIECLNPYFSFYQDLHVSDTQPAVCNIKWNESKYL